MKIVGAQLRYGHLNVSNVRMSFLKVVFTYLGSQVNMAAHLHHIVQVQPPTGLAVTDIWCLFTHGTETIVVV